MKTKRIVYSGLVAALYVVLCTVFQPISFRAVQFRVAEALTVLPFLDPVFIPGIFVGAFISNIIGGMGAWDIWLGSALSLFAAWLTYKMPKKALAPLPPVLVNAFGVSLYLSPLLNINYWYSVFFIGVGEAAVVYVIGLPLLTVFSKYYKKQ